MRKQIIGILIFLAIISTGYFLIVYTGPYSPLVTRWQSPGPENIPYLMKQLKHKDASRRGNAAFMLGRLYKTGPEFFSDDDLEKIRFELLKLSKDESIETRRLAIRSIGYFHFSDPETIAILTEGMNSPEPSMRGTIVEALGRSEWPGDIALPLLEAGLSKQECQGLEGVLKLIQKYGPEAHKSLPLVIEKVGKCDQDWLIFDVIYAIETVKASAIPEIDNPPGNQEDVEGVLLDRYRLALQVLIRDSPEYAYSLAKSALGSKDAETKDVISKVLPLIGENPEMINHLSLALCDERYETAQAAAELLVLVGNEAVRDALNEKISSDEFKDCPHQELIKDAAARIAVAEENS